MGIEWEITAVYMQEHFDGCFGEHEIFLFFHARGTHHLDLSEEIGEWGSFE